MTDASEALTVDQAAALVNKKPRTIRRWIATGLLPGYRPKVGRGTVVKRSELMAAVQLVPIEPDTGDDDAGAGDDDTIVSGPLLPPIDESE